ncbi:excinuclease ABC subunit C [Pontibacter liquoris]|uniref:excinuclease ABC subunit C n=1 Tax=Pontibacter liquoris TaxID=2905677 RepID=UPI001FA7066C|nr:excinuclease ABC subunit C [Pontibacter liquoris]
MQPQQAHYFVYIFGGNPRSELRIGIADDLQQMQNAPQQQAQASPENCKLVYYEHYDVEEIALNRERQIKNGGIDSTYMLIESMNPNWLDLSDMLNG